MVAYGIWDPVVQFESDISNRGIFYQMEDGRAHNPEAAGSNPAPATQRLMIRRKTMLSTMIREFKMIQNKLQFWCIYKNWIICDVFIRSCGLDSL